MALDVAVDDLLQLVAHRPLAAIVAVATLLGNRSNQSLIDGSH